MRPAEAGPKEAVGRPRRLQQATMAELQEVQITEEKPLLPGQTPETAKEAELAARILLDQGQVTMGGCARVGGEALLSPN